MRDRLIELLKKVPRNTRAFYDQFADYLLENGVIVPPCKVGDTIYSIKTGKVKVHQIERIELHKNGTHAHQKKEVGKSEILHSKLQLW